MKILFIRQKQNPLRQKQNEDEDLPTKQKVSNLFICIKNKCLSIILKNSFSNPLKLSF